MRVHLQDAILGEREHAARARARVRHRPHDPWLVQGLAVVREDQGDHEADDLAGREVLAGVLVHRFVELPDQLLEDVAHLQVRDFLRVQVDVLELLQHQEKQPGLVHLGDRVAEIELLQHLPHVVREPGDVSPQVRGQVSMVLQQPLERERRGVVEGEARRPAELRGQVLQLSLELRVGLQNFRLGWLQHAIQPPQHGQRQDHVRILGPLERVAQQVGHRPDEGDLLTEVVHGLHRRSIARICLDSSIL